MDWLLVVSMRVAKKPTSYDNLIAGISLAYEQMKKIIPRVGFLLVKKGERPAVYGPEDQNWPKTG